MLGPAGYLYSVAGLTLPEIQALQTGDEVYLIVVYRDDDGQRSIYFAGQTALEVNDYPDNRELIPLAHPELPFYSDSFNGERFVTDDWEATFLADAEAAQIELQATKARLAAGIAETLASLDIELS
jgi:hypothetical protein